MTTLREAAERALDALEYGHFAVADQAPHADVMAYLEAADKLREALAQPESEPVAYVTGFSKRYATVQRVDRSLLMCVGMALYRSPPQRKPLTDETLWEMWVKSPSDVFRFARAIERAHGIGEKE